MRFSLLLVCLLIATGCEPYETNCYLNWKLLEADSSPISFEPRVELDVQNAHLLVVEDLGEGLIFANVYYYKYKNETEKKYESEMTMHLKVFDGSNLKMDTVLSGSQLGFAYDSVLSSDGVYQNQRVSRLEFLLP